MKIAMPVDGNNMESDVCISFGRAPYFLFYDTQTKEGVFVENSAAQDQGGAGIKAAQAIVDRGAEVLVTPRCGENAAQVLKAAGIKMMKSIQGSALENINAFTEEKLALLDEIHPGFHGHGDGQA